MKKIIMMTSILLYFFVTGCDNMSDLEGYNNIEESLNVSEVTIKVITESKVTTSKIETTETTTFGISNNIQELDLSLFQNSRYLQYKKEFSYNNEYALSNGQKIIEDKNLYLEDTSGSRIPLIEVPEEQTQMYVKFCDMIDDNRFSYYIINHESTGGTGVYNLETSEDYRIENTSDHSGYVPVKTVNNYLLFGKGHISDFRGVSKLNLDNYEFTEIDCSPLIDNNIYYWGGIDISPSGANVAVYGLVSKDSEINNLNEYQVTIYSLNEEKILQTYNFYSENDYINHQLLYYDDNQVYLYTSQFGDNPKDYLYIINLK